MKREKLTKKENKSYPFDPSEVYEVTYVKAKYHAKGSKGYVSLPVAISFINKGMVKSTPEIDAAITKYGMGELVNKK